MRAMVSEGFEAAGMPTRDEWDAFVRASGPDVPFLCWDWLTAWWQVYGPGARLVLLTVRGDDGTLLGLLPLYSRRDRSGPLRGLTGGATLRVVGTGGDTSPDWVGPRALPGHEESVAEALADALAREGDGVLLTDLADDDPLTGKLEAALRLRSGFVAVARQAGAVCPYVDLPTSAGEVLGRVDGKLRYNVRSRRRKLEAEHRARVFVWEDAARAGEGIGVLAALHRRRFAEKGEKHGFSSPSYVAFHEEVARRFARDGHLRLYALEAAGGIVAMLYCFRFGDRVYHFQSGFDPDWAKAGVGQVLVASALELATAEGARRFDFLKGEYPYKADWATGQRRTVRLVAGRANAWGLWHFYGHHVRPELGRLLRGEAR